LADLTAKRDQFNYFPKNYYQQMLKSFKGSLTLFLAEYDKKIISAAMMFYFKGTGFYLHGASDYQYRSLMAPYLIQWEGIRQAKKQGCLVYDFWGIAPRIKKEIPPPSESEEQGNGYQESDFDPQHPLIGVTRFKIGFAPKGEIIAYPGCWELPYQKLWYNLYRIAKRFLYSRG
jgi:lipid II:glycine glycyltransferase (peptidoglycan interpeptide bridge formation enzyme)